jgi:hypothetical protein
MSKKVRGPVRSHKRPGTRQATDRTGTARRRPVSQLEAAEVIAQDVVEERPVEAAEEVRTVARTVTTRTGPRTKPGSLLAVLIALWLALVIFRVIPLPFY